MFQVIRDRQDSFVLFMELILALWIFVARLTGSQGLPLQLNQDTVAENANFIIEKGTAFGQILTMNKGITEQLIEGDIMPDPSRSAMICTSCYWPASSDGSVIIPYEISTAYSDFDKSLIKISVIHMEFMTCLKFPERKTEADYLYIDSGNGCWSSLGKTGGKQAVSLNKDGCLAMGTAHHEIMHALGFYHEQSRSDRDSYVDIIWKYINNDRRSNFNKEITNNFDLPYDYSSVMHYSSGAFSNTNGKNTIIPKPDPNVPIGQRSGLSHLDVRKINKLYKCNVCRTKLTASSGSFSSDGISFGTGGSCVWYIQVALFKKVYLTVYIQHIPSSSGCSESYLKLYDGPDKESKLFMDKICGSVTLPPLISTTMEIIVEFVSTKDPSLSKFSGDYKTVNHGGTFYSNSGFFMSPSYATGYQNNMEVVYSVLAPAQSKISLEFRDFQLQYCRFTCSCICDYVVVIDGPSMDSRSLGKFCGFHLPPKLVSTGNVMLVIFHSDHSLNAKGFYVNYQSV